MLQEKLKWQKEQEEFNRRRREHDIQLVEIEQQEVSRREEEITRRNEALDEKRRKHRLIQDAVAEQVRQVFCFEGSKLPAFIILQNLTEFETEYIGIPDLKGVSKDVEVHCIISHGLNKSKIKMDRKVLADIAYNEPEVFKSIVKKVQSSLN